MLAATMAIFEFGVSLTAQQSQMIPPRSVYTDGASAQNSDRLWLKLLNDTQFIDSISRDLASRSLCDQLMCRINELDSSRCIGKNAYQKGFGELSGFQDGLIDDLNHPFPSACVLSNGDHRILVVPSPDDFWPPYRVYSCLTRKEPLCLFEK